jgi:leader peptidase (prepilin peptidase)/N-methyltransferase
VVGVDRNEHGGAGADTTLSNVTIAEVALSPWFVRACAIVFGLVWGSFLNVVIYRVPREMSVVRPGSHCPACGKPVRAYDNIPVVSYLILRGRARCCGAKMSPRYLVVELIGGALSLAIVEVILQQLPGDTTLVRAGAIYLADLAFSLALVAAAFIDAEHMYLPDTITIGGTILGIGTSSLRDLGYVDALLGALVGFAGVWLPFGLLYKVVRGRQGMGLGDAKLTMLAGAWFGWPGAAFVFFAGALQATIGALVILVTRGKIDEPDQVKADRAELERAAAGGDEEAKRALEEDPLGKPPEGGVMASRLSFGPFLILACLEYLFAGDWLRDRYQGFLR